MEETLVGILVKKKFQSVMIETQIAEKLKSLNKGSYNTAIKHLLGINPEKNLIEKIKQNEEDVLEIKEKLEKLVRLNGLRL